MNISSSTVQQDGSSLPVSALSYRDVSAAIQADELSETTPAFTPPETDRPVPSEPVQQEVEELIARARSEAERDTEQRLLQLHSNALAEETAKIEGYLKQFRKAQEDYFMRVEGDVVNLALAISAKILHREVRMDPMLLAALVRIALDRLQEGSSVIIRVAPQDASGWRLAAAELSQSLRVEIREDEQLQAQECVVTTKLGSANLGIEAQLKEIEQGFFDLMARKPLAQ